MEDCEDSDIQMTVNMIHSVYMTEADIETLKEKIH
jgi:hypothetical protein